MIGRVTVYAAIASAAVLTSACTRRPKLLLTEVQGDAVELYVDESAGTSVPLNRISFEVLTTAPHADTIDLIGTISGGGFVVVFAQPGYTGPPVQEPYTDISGRTTPGIKVQETLFGPNPAGVGSAYRVVASGRGPSGIAGLFYVRYEVDDVVKFGPQPRPAISGALTEDATPPVMFPPPPGNIGRKWGPSGPIDGDLESDWKQSLPSFGRATP
ncbi:MAG: hypothetical protein M3373_07930 [Gemmatimonadota bacterium]|nr:hypothetical protein [Gemmatimonadota bacterium]